MLADNNFIPLRKYDFKLKLNSKLSVYCLLHRTQVFYQKIKKKKKQTNETNEMKIFDEIFSMKFLKKKNLELELNFTAVNKI